MDMSYTFHAPPSLLSVALVYGSVWVFPVGAVVMRPHLVEATGARYAAKVTLYSLAWLSAPLALLTVVTIVQGGFEAGGILWRLLVWLWG
jgi:hypothetical protein